MATKDDILTIETLQKIVKLCEQDKVEPEAILSDNSEIRHKAIKSVRNSGVWATDIAVVGFIFSLVMLFNDPTTESYRIWMILIQIAAIFTSGAFALKLYNFKCTPTSAFVYIILSGLAASFAVPYIIIPFILIPIVLALTRWSTYKSWFNDSKKKFKKMEKKLKGQA